MKQLELNLNKRLLVVERQLYKGETPTIINFELNRWDLDLICKGSELTSELSESFVDDSKYMNMGGESGYVDYNVYPDGLILSALGSFISAIESKGYYWGNKKFHSINSEEEFDELWASFEDWQSTESKTFTPDKTLIFEII